MHSYFSKNLREEFRCAIGHQMLLGVRTGERLKVGE
jgi:hypothetical protein